MKLDPPNPAVLRIEGTGLPMTYMTFMIGLRSRRVQDVSREFTVAEAKARFAECLREAERGEPTVITRHGKRVAAVVPVEDLDRLATLRAAGPEGGLASLAGGWAGSDEISDHVDGRRRGRRRRS